jgi:hypothetical protein
MALEGYDIDHSYLSTALRGSVFVIFGHFNILILEPSSNQLSLSSVGHSEVNLRSTWPPTMAEIVGNLHFIGLWLNLGQETTYPLPKNLLPIDLEKKAAKRNSSCDYRLW